MYLWRCRQLNLPRNKLARRVTPGCAGCSPSSIALITLPAQGRQIIFVRKKLLKSHLSTAMPLTDPMKPTPNSPELAPLLAFGAHPDDIEFGCGGIIARETKAGRKVHFVVCSSGEAGTYGTPKLRTAEAKRAPALLGATIEFAELDGDAHLEIRVAHA